MVKKTTLLETIKLEKGELYAVIGRRRYVLARFKPNIRVYEHETGIPTLGSGTCGVKRYHVVLTLCEDAEFTRRTDDEFFKTVSRFEMRVNLWRTDGTFAWLDLGCVSLLEIHADGTWEFEVDAPEAVVKDLLGA